MVEDQEFAESKAAQSGQQKPTQNKEDGFMNIPDGLDEEIDMDNMPFN